MKLDWESVIKTYIIWVRIIWARYKCDILEIFINYGSKASQIGEKWYVLSSL